MSRYAERINETKVIEYGFDRVPRGGYFYSIKENGEVVEAGDTRSTMICSPVERHVKRGEVVEVLRENGVKETHIREVVMDQPL